ncbi:ubiquinone biosynthesis protein COQ9 [Brachybacterium fresconis]|uniref:Ubiquinone biosynthesis protein COQ9 n=1 Tax=Brachybacterium fresconis TaxID=173363 RepID=A0ABS4YLS5_9MICO|nr:ubiquinone biosynthesis protein COQ9 [Brachybacterium fresconis]
MHQRWELARMAPEEEWTEEVVVEAAKHHDSNIA